MKKPKVRLIGENGNVYAVMGRVSKVLKRADLTEESVEYMKRCRNAESYDEVLRITMEYCEVE